jgi:hypothetical protein
MEESGFLASQKDKDDFVGKHLVTKNAPKITCFAWLESCHFQVKNGESGVSSRFGAEQVLGKMAVVWRSLIVNSASLLKIQRYFINQN